AAVLVTRSKRSVPVVPGAPWRRTRKDGAAKVAPTTDVDVDVPALWPPAISRTAVVAEKPGAPLCVKFLVCKVAMAPLPVAERTIASAGAPAAKLRKNVVVPIA